MTLMSSAYLRKTIHVIRAELAAQKILRSLESSHQDRSACSSLYSIGDAMAQVHDISLPILALIEAAYLSILGLSFAVCA